ncbi:MAG: sugar ABC transporter permease [Fimbriimonadaceae bacterium]|nr:sugar ABC transporter permease [Fimbriimonadaceae bacterium]
MRRKGQGPFVLGFLAPAGLLYLVFVLWPLVQSLHLSTFQWSGLSPVKKFVGADNFQRLAADPVFWTSVRNTLILIVVCGVALIAGGVGLGHVVNEETRWARAIRSIYLYPQAVSLVVVAIIWYFLLSPQIGLVNNLLRAVGLGSWERAWLGEPQTALGGVAAAFVWYALGFYSLLFASGLKSLPAEVNEAAELDGSVRLHRFWHVTWPMLWPIKRVAVVYTVVNVVNTFALVIVMTRGGDPDRATETMLTYLYEQGFEVSRFGYATSIAVANFLVVMAISLAVLFWFRRDPTAARA